MIMKLAEDIIFLSRYISIFLGGGESFALLTHSVNGLKWSGPKVNLISSDYNNKYNIPGDYFIKKHKFCHVSISRVLDCAFFNKKLKTIVTLII